VSDEIDFVDRPFLRILAWAIPLQVTRPALDIPSLGRE
jgi:hypothetical protein